MFHLHQAHSNIKQFLYLFSYKTKNMRQLRCQLKLEGSWISQCGKPWWHLIPAQSHCSFMADQRALWTNEYISPWQWVKIYSKSIDHGFIHIYCFYVNARRLYLLSFFHDNRHLTSVRSVENFCLWHTICSYRYANAITALEVIFALFSNLGLINLLMW